MNFKASARIIARACNDRLLACCVCWRCVVRRPRDHKGTAHPPAHTAQPPLNLPLPDAAQVAYHNARAEEASQHTIRISKTAAIGDLLEELRRQLPAEAQGDVPLRLLEVYQWKIWQVSGWGWGEARSSAARWLDGCARAPALARPALRRIKALTPRAPAPCLRPRAPAPPQIFDPRARVETIGDNTWHLRVEARRPCPLGLCPWPAFSNACCSHWTQTAP